MCMVWGYQECTCHQNQLHWLILTDQKDYNVPGDITVKMDIHELDSQAVKSFVAIITDSDFCSNTSYATLHDSISY